jgi:hypothetical protein
MASERHGKHNNPTIAFRVNSYEQEQIEQRVKISGMKKQDYIARSCIYNRVCVVGKKETVQLIRKELAVMYGVLRDIKSELEKVHPAISEEGMTEMQEQYRAFLDAMLWMLEGARYLWEDAENGNKSTEKL